MKKNLSFVVASLIVLAIVGFVGYRAYMEANPKIPSTFDNLKVAYQEDGINNYVLIDLAEDKGYFKQNGLTIERKVGLKNLTAFVTSGEVDISQSNFSIPLSSYLSDQDLTVVAVSERYSGGQHIVSRLPLDKLDQVKSVSVDRVGGSLQNNVWVYSKNLGFDPTKLNYVVSSSPQNFVALLEKGEIDLGTTSNYEAYKTLKEKGGYYFIDLAKAYEGVASPLGVVTSSKTVAAKGDVLKRYVASVKKASDYFNKHKSEMVDFIVNKYGFSKEDAESAYERLMASKKGTDFTSANTDIIKDLLEAVKVNNKPSNPDKDLSGFIAKL